MTDPKQIVRDFLATFSAGDIDGVLDRLSDDATWWVSGTIDGMSGTNDKATLGALLRQVKPLYRGGALRIDPTGMIAEGHRVAVEAQGHAELTGGGVYANRYHFVFELDGDRIRSVREYSDTLHMRDTFAP